MSSLTFNKKQQKIIDEIPLVSDFSETYFYTTQSKFDVDLIQILEKAIGINDEILSNWLNITTRTLRNYKNKDDLVLKDNIKEHIILILSLYKHGSEVFENVVDFELWLSKRNVFLDNRPPSEFLNIISGIKFIDNRLTAIEFGENA